MKKIEELIELAVSLKEQAIHPGYCIPAIENETRPCKKFKDDCDSCRRQWFKDYRERLRKEYLDDPGTEPQYSAAFVSVTLSGEAYIVRQYIGGSFAQCNDWIKEHQADVEHRHGDNTKPIIIKHKR